MTADLSDPRSPALRDTAGAERRLADAGVAVRRAERTDLPALLGFARATFGEAWSAELAHSIDRPGAGCHLAVRRGGHAAGRQDRPADAADSATADSATAEAGDVLGFAAYGSSRPSWFGPMGTAPDARGLGIGGILLRRCLQEQRAAGHRRVEIGWVGPVPFYAGAAGARIERVFFLYRRQL